MLVFECSSSREIFQNEVRIEGCACVGFARLEFNDHVTGGKKALGRVSHEGWKMLVTTENSGAFLSVGV